mmetsp:Transcript_18162/g.43684  ORF Transcript_18162/g.43684 Transcript_18162/m.43684 type:complete len:230 (+) Transcript_18162:726-1415(+)
MRARPSLDGPCFFANAPNEIPGQYCIARYILDLVSTDSTNPTTLACPRNMRNKATSRFALTRPGFCSQCFGLALSKILIATGFSPLVSPCARNFANRTVAYAPRPIALPTMYLPCCPTISVSGSATADRSRTGWMRLVRGLELGVTGRGRSCVTAPPGAAERLAASYTAADGPVPLFGGLLPATAVLGLTLTTRSFGERRQGVSPSFPQSIVSPVRGALCARGHSFTRG